MKSLKCLKTTENRKENLPYLQQTFKIHKYKIKGNMEVEHHNHHTKHHITKNKNHIKKVHQFQALNLI